MKGAGKDDATGCSENLLNAFEDDENIVGTVTAHLRQHD